MLFVVVLCEGSTQWQRKGACTGKVLDLDSVELVDLVHFVVFLGRVDQACSRLGKLKKLLFVPVLVRSSIESMDIDNAAKADCLVA